MLKYTDTQLKAEIEQHLTDLMARGETLRPQWVTHAICQSHREGLAPDESDHVAFWEFTGYTTTRKFATECINRYDTGLDDTAPIQPPLPGFNAEFLQAYYVVTRDGEDRGIRTTDCTDEELLAKASLFKAQSRRLVAHARELERFVEWRRSTMRTAS